jgi:glycosyltransferase involved in cell wall biosynthesis
VKFADGIQHASAEPDPRDAVPSGQHAHAIGTARESEVCPRRVLMICYLFPPAGGSAIPAVQRVIKFVRGMVGSRWKPLVLTLEPEYYESYIAREDAFLRDLPADTVVERTRRVTIFKTILRATHRIRAAMRAPRASQPPSGGGVAAPAAVSSDPSTPTTMTALKAALDNAVQTPDPHIGWLPHAYFRGRSLVRQARIDCIYATGSPWSALLVGALLKRSTGLPLIADFRDPWVTNPYRAHFPPWRKRIEHWLEQYVVRTADLVIANTCGLRDEFRNRYSGSSAPRFEAIYNSVDRSVVAASGASRSTRRVRLVHAGFLYGPRDPLTFLRAVAKRRETLMPGAAEDLVVDLVGAVQLEYSIHERLSELGIVDVVTVHGPLPHAQCEAMLKDADAFLLLQPGTKTQLPSKLFEYVTFGKPILTLGEPGGETYRFASEVLQSLVADCNDEAAIVASIDRLVNDVRSGNAIDARAWQTALSRYSAAAVNEQFLESLDWVASGGKRQHARAADVGLRS